MGYVISDPGIYYKENNSNALLKTYLSNEGSTLYLICNFPDDAKKLKVSDQGLDIVLSGKVYESGDSIYKYLELTELKKK